MTKEIVIIALIILIIYLYYQQQNNNQSTNIVESPNIQQLRSEINYYQNLYEQRLVKDLGDEEKVKKLTEQLDLAQQDLKNSQDNADELEKDLEKKEQENQEQLRKINLLFDDQATHYKVIGFNGLYSLLQKISEKVN